METLKSRVSHGVYINEGHYGIFGDINLEDLSDIDITFAELPLLQYPVGISRFITGNGPAITGYEIPSELIRLDGEAMPMEHAYPQYSVYEENYILMPESPMDGYAAIPVPVNPRAYNPVIMDYQLYEETDLSHDYLCLKLTDFAGSGMVVETDHDMEMHRFTAWVENDEPFDWHIAFTIPVTMAPADIWAIAGDDTVMLDEMYDYYSMELGMHRIVSVRVQQGWDTIIMDYRGFYEMYWNISVGWNLISWPSPSVGIIDDIFPDSPIGAYYYDQESRNYVPTDELEIGKGYFLYSRVSEDVEIPEVGLPVIEVTLYPGWNLIGVPARRMAMFNIYDYPEIIPPVYGFNPETNAYLEPAMMNFGNGFWVLSADTVEITLP